MTVQLGLDLQNLDPLSPRYLVIHSGIIKALETVRVAIGQTELNPELFFCFSLIGEKGSGKTHLLRTLKAESQKSEKVNFEEFDFSSEDEQKISAYISAYERAKTSGGIVIVAIDTTPDQLTNPHLRSRVLAGQTLTLEKPKESELREILTSLLERGNFNLSEKALSYIISRVPASPLSFAVISDKLQEVFREQGKTAKLSVVKDLLNSKN